MTPATLPDANAAADAAAAATLYNPRVIPCEAMIDRKHAQDLGIRCQRPAVFLTPDGYHLCDTCGRAIAGDWSRTPAIKRIDVGPRSWQRPRELAR